MIKAYHQIGSDDWSGLERARAFDHVVSLGRIEPAILRLDRREMKRECFDAARGGDLVGRYPKAKPVALKALEEIAREKLQELPESGFTRSMFNCLDLIAGDLELVFLRPHGWYSVDNGFVFDAEELIHEGARFRRQDMLGFYANVTGYLVGRRFSSVRSAKKAINKTFEGLHFDYELRGQDAIVAMHRGDVSDNEIVWPGELPLSLAIEAWRNGERVAEIAR